MEKLKDKQGLAIKDVEVITNESKARIIEKFKEIKKNAYQFVKDNNCKLGIFFVTTGFMVRENEGLIKHSTDLLTKQGAPLEDKSVAHHYLITTEGEVINFN